ncbi:MazG nucleotide pyrophosphohydrolase domain-containing protein [Hydrocarboniphaga sp.]|uniref:MazG nucleotide pyrophosphohydrolase domain-containing protein n=1 Tax=Hydrocarboniphaga sp. TaxID=2033016 RepID=UPI00260AE71E|nr:MazG nucleotide pyrophosphohydrolase domain-containing protein [Hydrocarboniphaga sp.]
MSDPLIEAEALQCDAALQGFDWNTLAELWPKLFEEIAELQEAVDQGAARRLDELGDLLFMVVNIARHLGADPAAALATANAKFRRRYGHVMAHAATLPPLGSPERLDRMEALWVEAKKLGL